MPTNPYASFLGDRDPRQVIAATPDRLSALFTGLSDDQASRSPAPGKWSPAQILCHLADCEIAFAFRLRQAMSQENHVIQPFDQDAWAKTYDSFDLAAALAVFTSVRHWNVRWIAGLPAPAFDKKLSHPERGEMPLRSIVETMAGHDLNHLSQIEEITTQAAIL
jgi:hypothetical protein